MHMHGAPSLRFVLHDMHADPWKPVHKATGPKKPPMQKLGTIADELVASCDKLLHWIKASCPDSCICADSVTRNCLEDVFFGSELRHHI